MCVLNIKKTIFFIKKCHIDRGQPWSRNMVNMGPEYTLSLPLLKNRRHCQTLLINFGFKNMRMVGVVNQRLLYARKIKQLEM